MAGEKKKLIIIKIIIKEREGGKERTKELKERGRGGGREREGGRRERRNGCEGWLLMR